MSFSSWNGGMQMWVSARWAMLPVAGITCGQGTGKQEEDGSSCQTLPKSKWGPAVQGGLTGQEPGFQPWLCNRKCMGHHTSLSLHFLISKMGQPYGSNRIITAGCPSARKTARKTQCAKTPWAPVPIPPFTSEEPPLTPSKAPLLGPSRPSPKATFPLSESFWGALATFPPIRRPHIHPLGDAFPEHWPRPRPQTGPSGQRSHPQAYPCPSGSWLGGGSKGTEPCCWGRGWGWVGEPEQLQTGGGTRGPQAVSWTRCQGTRKLCCGGRGADNGDRQQGGREETAQGKTTLKRLTGVGSLGAERTGRWAERLKADAQISTLGD